MSLKLPNGGFIMHERGEEDVRGVYIVCVVAKLLGILDEDLLEGVVEYLVEC